MNRSRRYLTLLAALFATAGVGLALPAQAIHPLTILEDGLELASGDTRWPDEASGQFQVLACTGCAKSQYVIARDAAFKVGGRAASYAEFLAAVRGGRDRALFVYVRRSTGEVSRARVIP